MARTAGSSKLSKTLHSTFFVGAPLVKNQPPLVLGYESLKLNHRHLNLCIDHLHILLSTVIYKNHFRHLTSKTIKMYQLRQN